MLARVILKDSSAVAIGTIKFPVSAPDLHFHNLIPGFVKLLYLILQWWNMSVLSKPSFWPVKSENTKEQNFSKDQTERNLFKSSVLLKCLKQAMTNKTWLWSRGHCRINTSKFWYKLYLLFVMFGYCQSPCREDVSNRPYIFSSVKLREI